MRTLPRTHGVGGQITRVTIAGCNRLQSTDAIRGAFHAPSELETLLDWIKGKVLQGSSGKMQSVARGRTESQLQSYRAAELQGSENILFPSTGLSLRLLIRESACG